MISEDDNPSDINENEEYTKSPGIRYKIMSYNGGQIKVHLQNRGKNFAIVSIVDRDRVEETKEETSSKFINIKSITDCLTQAEILSEFYEYLEIDSSRIQEWQYSLNSSPSSSVDLLWDLNNDDFTIKTLVRRRKHEKLNYDQIKFLKNQIDHSGLSMKEISCRFFVSLPYLRRINNLNSPQISRSPRRPPLKIYGEEYRGIKREVKFYNKNWEFPYTVKDVKQYVDDSMDASFPGKIIRKVMKNDLNLNFKKWKSRPSNFSLTRAKAIRKLFCTHFVNKLGPSTLIINVDESTVSRLSKINYSWSKKGANAELKNIPFSGLASLILAILSNGCWICMLTPSTVNSDIFVLFVDRLKEWIEEWNRFDYANVILILDNWPSHRSFKSKQKLRELGYLVAFLPQYSLHLAPVELAFSIIKRQLKNQTKSRGLNLSEMSNYGEFRRSMKELDKDRVRFFFIKSFTIS